MSNVIMYVWNRSHSLVVKKRNTENFNSHFRIVNNVEHVENLNKIVTHCSSPKINSVNFLFHLYLKIVLQKTN